MQTIKQSVKINGKLLFVNNGTAKMVKFKRKKLEERKTKKGKGTTKDQTKAAEYVGHLWELHKLQGAILFRLRKEIQ